MNYIEYRPLTDDEQSRIQRILVAGNEVVFDLASMPGMTSSPARRNAYRRAILGFDVLWLSDVELRMCGSVVPYKRCQVQGIETVKDRIVEAFIAQVVRIAKRTIPFARFYRNEEDDSNLLDDLSAEGLHGLSHAIYTYTDPTVKFLTFMTTVVKRWLRDYCVKMPPVSLLHDSLIMETIPSRIVPESGLLDEIEKLHLTPLQRACLEAKMGSVPLTHVQTQFGCKKAELTKAVAEMRRLILRLVRND